MNLVGTLLGTTKQRASTGTLISIARGLGWFSLGLGLLEIAAPHQLARLMGLRRRHEGLLQAYGLREVATGTAIIAARNPTPFIWVRVAGDALDLSSLGAALVTRRRKTGLAIALAGVSAITALDIFCAQSLHSRRTEKQLPDYRGRSGFPRSAEAMRGVAREAKPAKEKPAPVLTQTIR